MPALRGLDYLATFILMAVQRLNVQPQAARANRCEFELRCARLDGCNVLLGGPLASIASELAGISEEDFTRPGRLSEFENIPDFFSPIF
jgi:hypothetical protein